MDLILYKNCKIKRNDVIEHTSENSIFDYLNTLTQETVVNINLNKRVFDDTTVNIKLNKKLKKVDVYSYNYACIKNDDEYYFYFIANKNWLADSTTNLVLYLDVLNTYEHKIKIVSDTSNYDTCNVIREHRNRYDSNGSPLYDRIDEGFDSLPMELGLTQLLDPNKDEANNKKWYIGYYKAMDENTRSVAQVFSTEGEDHTRVYYNLTTSILKSYFTAPGQVLIAYTNINDTFLNKNSEPKDPSSTDFWDNKNINLIYITHPTAESYLISIGGYWVTSNMIHFSEKEIEINDSELDYYSKDPFIILLGNKITTGSVADKTLYLEDLLGTDYTKTTSTATAGLNYIIPPFKDTLRADNNILKIIEIPYFGGNDVSLNPYYNYDLGAVVGILTDDIYEYSIGSMPGVGYGADKVTDVTKVKYRDIDPKLHTSQFQVDTIKYDSFNYNLSYEDYDSYETKLTLKEYIPLDMSDNIGFKIEWSGIHQNEFDQWLICERNNQVPTMNNDYLDYMRNGYNYDIKNRNIQSAMNWVSFAGNVGASALTLGPAANKLYRTNAEIKELSKYSVADLWGTNGGKPILTEQANIDRLKENNPFTVQQLYNASTNIVSSLANNIQYEVQSKLAIDKKKRDYLNSSVNVSNSDNLSLFNIYNEGNKLRRSIYLPKEEICESILEIFKLTGYSTNQYKIPDLTTRSGYNYLQADIKFKDNYYIPAVFKNNIVESINEGITLFHNYLGEYDLDRYYENWEKCLNPQPEPEPEPEPEVLENPVIYGPKLTDNEKLSWDIGIKNTNRVTVTLEEVTAINDYDIDYTNPVEVYDIPTDKILNDSYSFANYYKSMWRLKLSYRFKYTKTDGTIIYSDWSDPLILDREKLTQPRIVINGDDGQRVQFYIYNDNEFTVSLKCQDFDDVDVKPGEFYEFNYQWPDSAEEKILTCYFSHSVWLDSDNSSITAKKEDFYPLEVTVTTELNEDGTFLTNNYVIKNTNKFKVTSEDLNIDIHGTKTYFEDFSLSAGGEISGDIAIDPYQDITDDVYFKLTGTLKKEEE